MEENKPGSFMEKLAGIIVDKRDIVIFAFLALCLFSAFSRNWVQVNDDITAYLPDSTETRQGLTLMNENFTTFATAEVMVENITYARAEELLERIEAVEGVKSVDFDDTEDHFKAASALFSITFDGLNEDEVSVQALADVKSALAGYDIYVNSEVGNPLKAIINSEMLVVDLIAVVIVISVLLLTSKTYAEIPVLLLTFGAAAVLNMGTNYLMGEISFVTDSVTIVLQLALALDYAIILSNRFQEEHETKPAREAAIVALSKAIPEISASSLTTVSGLLAMCLMQFRLGYDMGSVLIKAILLSLCSVFLLMPGLLVIFAPWIDKTHHKSFVPKINFLGKAVYLTRFIMPVIFIAVLVAGFVFSHRANYVYSQYSVSSIRQNEAQIAKKKIKDLFGEDNTFAIIVPSGDYDREAKLIAEIEEVDHTLSVLGLANVEAMDGYTITSSLNSRQFSELAGLDYEVATALYAAYAVSLEDYGQAVTNLENYSVPLIDLFDYILEKRDEVTISLDEDTEELLDSLDGQLADARLQLMNENWSRIVVTSDVPTEGDESFRYLDILHGITAKYYSESYVVGDTTSCADLKSSFEHDNTMISILTVLFVILVLIFTFNSVGMPILLIAIIQGAIWFNFSTPYLKGNNLFFLSYLIISSIQMGSNIDYAIVISSRYMELKQEMPLRDAMIETLNLAFPTIITSGTMLASAGMAIGFLTSNETISSIGIYLGQGTIISIFIVMCVLPQVLLFGDLIIRKTSFSISNPIQRTQRTGMMRINGRVRGSLNGIVDAEIHGIFRGDINAIIDVGNVEMLPEDLLEAVSHENNGKAEE